MSINRCIKKIWYIVQAMDYYSALKKEGNSAICDNMGESKRHLLNEISLTRRINIT